MPTFIKHRDHPFICIASWDRGDDILIDDDEENGGLASVTKLEDSRKQQKEKLKKFTSRSSKKRSISDGVYQIRVYQPLAT